MGDDLARQAEPDDLSVQEWRFIDAYLNEASGIGVDAARIAGYGNTYSSWDFAARKLLDKPRIKAVVSDQLSQHCRTAEQTIHLLNQMLGANIHDFFALDDNGDIVTNELGQPKFDLNRARRNGKMHLVESITFTDSGIKISLPKKGETMALMMKFHGLLVEKVDVSVKTDGDAIRRELAARLRSVMDSLPPEERAKLVGPTLPGPASPLGGQASSTDGGGEGVGSQGGEIEV